MMDHERYQVINQWRDETVNALCCFTTDQENFVRQLSTRFDVLQAKVMQESGPSTWKHMSLMIMQKLFTHCAEKDWVVGAQHLIQRIDAFDDKNKKQCGDWGLQKVRSTEMFDVLFPLVQSHDINHSWIDNLAYSHRSDVFGYCLTQLDPQKVHWGRVAQYCVAGYGAKTNIELLLPHLGDEDVARMVIYACEYSDEDMLIYMYSHVFERKSAIEMMGNMTGEGSGLDGDSKDLFDQFCARIGLHVAVEDNINQAPSNKPRKI